jgi:hypothetical protein
MHGWVKIRLNQSQTPTSNEDLRPVVMLQRWQTLLETQGSGNTMVKSFSQFTLEEGARKYDLGKAILKMVDHFHKSNKGHTYAMTSKGTATYHSWSKGDKKFMVTYDKSDPEHYHWKHGRVFQYKTKEGVVKTFHAHAQGREPLSGHKSLLSSSPDFTKEEYIHEGRVVRMDKHLLDRLLNFTHKKYPQHYYSTHKRGAHFTSHVWQKGDHHFEIQHDTRDPSWFFWGHAKRIIKKGRKEKLEYDSGNDSLHQIEN